jgi:hypothetical protein
MIPDFTSRRDEIGHLSGALRDMTNSLYNRIDAIEAFAADVAHELKNPLTSLRSAVETFVHARNDEQRARLIAIITDDVKRLDRLITDISDASRLDAELVRSRAVARRPGTAAVHHGLTVPGDPAAGRAGSGARSSPRRPRASTPRRPSPSSGMTIGWARWCATFSTTADPSRRRTPP